MVTIAKYIPANEEHVFHDMCDHNEWRAPRCPFCINKMYVIGLKCERCGAECIKGECKRGDA